MLIVVPKMKGATVMKKGTFLIAKAGNKSYQIIGRWGSDIVLMQTSEKDDQVLIYSPSELDGLIEEGHFRILHEVQAEGGKK